jgi:hypothetical protein
MRPFGEKNKQKQLARLRFHLAPPPEHFWEALQELALRPKFPFGQKPPFTATAIRDEFARADFLRKGLAGDRSRTPE